MDIWKEDRYRNLQGTYPVISLSFATSSNSLVGKVIREGNKNIKQEFDTLLDGKTITVTIDEQLVYNQLSGKKGAVWSFLPAGGYLKVVSTEFVERTGTLYYQMALTNKEVRICFSGKKGVDRDCRRVCMTSVCMV